MKLLIDKYKLIGKRCDHKLDGWEDLDCKIELDWDVHLEWNGDVPSLDVVIYSMDMHFEGDGCIDDGSGDPQRALDVFVDVDIDGMDYKHNFDDFALYVGKNEEPRILIDLEAETIYFANT